MYVTVYVKYSLSHLNLSNTCRNLGESGYSKDQNQKRENKALSCNGGSEYRTVVGKATQVQGKSHKHGLISRVLKYLLKKRYKKRTRDPYHSTRTFCSQKKKRQYFTPASSFLQL